MLAIIMKMLFQFGTFPELSLAELLSRAPHLAGGKMVSGRFYVAEGTESAAWLMQNLGGTVKIYDILDIKPTPAAVADHIANRLQEKNKIIFGISTLNKGKNNDFGLATKRELQKTSRPVRLVTSRTSELSSVTTFMEKLLPPDGIEIFLLNDGKNTLACETAAIQPFEEFSQRDYSRPGRNALRGMLPPKLAKMMINLAIGSSDPSKLSLYDPFCGSGTLLIESALLGVGQIFGSDLAKDAVEDAKKAVIWAKNNLDSSADSIDVFNHDATKTPTHIKPGTIDVIVTEPFLGKPLRQGEIIKPSEKAGLITLYKRALAALSPILKTNGCVVLALPFQPKPKSLLPIDQIIKNTDFIIDPLGKELPFYEYARPDQRTGRQIIRLKKR